MNNCDFCEVHDLPLSLLSAGTKHAGCVCSVMSTSRYVASNCGVIGGW